MLCLAHHSFHNDDLGAQLLMNGKDVDETQSEHHEVYRQDGPARLIRVLSHPANPTQEELFALLPLAFH